MDKNDIIEYVMNTPHNTNRAVLNSMLNQLGGGGGAEPLIVNTEYDESTGRFIMDKTFGEIRRAHLGGQPIVVVDIQDDGTNSVSNYSSVEEISISITEDSISATISAGQSYGVRRDEPPYTLEAIDDLYPYYN